MNKIAKVLELMVYDLEEQLIEKRAKLIGVKKDWGESSGQAQYIEGQISMVLHVLHFIVNKTKEAKGAVNEQV